MSVWDGKYIKVLFNKTVKLKDGSIRLEQWTYSGKFICDTAIERVLFDERSQSQVGVPLKDLLDTVEIQGGNNK
jgi:hypothetical protein